jgi:hypothetical protein
MDESHTDNILNINEGDRVVIETTEGATFDMTCVERATQHSQNPDLVRETMMWHFDLGGDEVVMVRVEGLRESLDMDPFPHDKAIWDTGREMNLGYAERIKLLDPSVEA